ncbi:MAG: hypothetical protein ACREVQ_01555 [Burkholderiales bacterium]
MRKIPWIALTFSIVLAGCQAFAHDEDRDTRLAARGGPMQGCADMMGSGMMGETRPNERWRSSPGDVR